jgi:hypothetical protein
MQRAVPFLSSFRFVFLCVEMGSTESARVDASAVVPAELAAEVLSDLVVEAISEAFAATTDQAEWWRVACVCRRWHAVSRPVFARIAATRCPHFVCPADGSKFFEFNSTLDTVKLIARPEYQYMFALVRGVPLQGRKTPMAAKIGISQPAGAYVGFMVAAENAAQTHK